MLAALFYVIQTRQFVSEKKLVSDEYYVLRKPPNNYTMVDDCPVIHFVLLSPLTNM